LLATPPLRLPLQERRQAERTLARHLAGLQTSHRLRVFASHRSSRLPTTTNVNHRLLGKTNKWEPIYTYITFYGISYLPTTSNPVSLSSVFCLYPHSCTTQYTRWSMSIDAKPLATESMPVSWKYYLLYFSHSVCVFIVFLQYTKTTEYPFYFNSVALYSTGIYTHPFTLKPFHHGPY